MKKAYLYIGQNNDTKKLESDKIEKIVSSYFDGFTAIEVIGFWRGKKELSLKIEIVTDEENAKLVRLCKELKKELKQESIGLEITKSNFAFIQ